MKVSILTATFNRKKCLQKLYDSLLENSNYDVNLEWLIMDDGSTDGTKEFVNCLKGTNTLEIKYFHQENKGKMSAINNLIQYVTGDLIIECDSDDYFASNAIRIINNNYNKTKDISDIYAFAYLKYDTDLCNIGNSFENTPYKTTMFDLYFKDGITGDKALVYIANVRKQYSYILEKNERFSTEDRMNNKMDMKYKILCINEPIMICEYLEEGYSKNILKLFKQNPYGYYEYYKQLLNFNMKNVLFSKRLYAIKHYIIFCYLTKQKNILENIKGNLNIILVILLYIPGYIKSWIKFKNFN